MLNCYSSSNIFNVFDTVFLVHCANCECYCDRWSAVSDNGYVYMGVFDIL